MDALETAKRSEDPEAIAGAGRPVLASALRQMAGLRLLQSAFPQAIDLYKRSLDFEELPDAHVDLAIAYMRAKQADDALTEVAKAIFADPNNARAWHVQGKAWMMKNEHQRAAESLARSVSIQGDLEAAYSLAVTLLRLGEKSKASIVFGQMLDFAGDRANFHILFGRAYRDADLMEDAVREFRRAIEMDAKSSHAHYYLGLAYLVQNEWTPTEQARKEFLAEVALNSTDFLGNYFMGVITSGEKNYVESDRYLHIAAAARPDWPEPWLYLGLNAYGRGEADTAEKLLVKAVQLTGSEEERNNYQIRRAHYVLGRLLSAKGNKKDAAMAMQRSRELEAKSLAASHAKISAMGSGTAVLSPQDIERTDESVGMPAGIVDSAGELDSGSLARTNMTEEERSRAKIQEERLRVVLGSTFNDLGTSEARGKQYELALAHFHEAERWQPQLPGLARNIGIAAVRAGKYSDAQPALREVLAQFPGDNVARSLLGLSLFMTDQFAEAAQSFEQVGDVLMSDAGLAYAWAASLAKVNRPTRAASVLERLERQDLPAENLLLIGETWAQIGDDEHAVSAFRKALERDPSLPKGHYHSGLSMIRLNRSSDAANEFKAELALNPTDSDAEYHLAFALLQQSQVDEARDILEKLVVARPRHAEAQYELGKVLLEEGKVAAAVPHLEAAARLTPEKDYVHYQLQAAYRKQSRREDADRELKVYREIKANRRERTVGEAPSPKEVTR